MTDNSPKKTTDTNAWISMQEASEACSYSQEYLSLRARQGKLFSKKIGRNWYTPRKALNDYLAQQSVLVYQPMLASAMTPEEPEANLPGQLPGQPKRPKIIEEFERLNPQIFGAGSSGGQPINIQNQSTQDQLPASQVAVTDRARRDTADQNVLSKLDRLSDSLQVFAQEVSKSIPEINRSQKTTFEIVETYTGSWWYRLTSFNRMSRNILKSPVRMAVTMITALVLLFTLVGGFSFGLAVALAERSIHAFK